MVEEENEGEGREEESREGRKVEVELGSLAKLKLTPNLFIFSFSYTGKQHIHSSPSIILPHSNAPERRTRKLRRAEKGEPRDFASFREEGCSGALGRSWGVEDRGEHVGRGYRGQGEVLLVWIGGCVARKTGRTFDLDTSSPCPRQLLPSPFTKPRSASPPGPLLHPNRTLTSAPSLSFSTYRHL